MPQFLNSPPPQTVTGPGVSNALGYSTIQITATDDCFICISPNGSGVDGQPVGPTNGHFVTGGTSFTIGFINPTHKLGVNTGKIYISAVSG